MRGQTEGSHEEINVEEAIRIHGNMVYRLALVQMKNKSEAEDVFQEVFLRLVKYKERAKCEKRTVQTIACGCTR